MSVTTNIKNAQTNEMIEHHGHDDAFVSGQNVVSRASDTSNDSSKLASLVTSSVKSDPGADDLSRWDEMMTLVSPRDGLYRHRLHPTVEVKRGQTHQELTGKAF